jgi:hypothetical protein
MLKEEKGHYWPMSFFRAIVYRFLILFQLTINLSFNKILKKNAVAAAHQKN